jgi:NodT family efflux transporter outer membrane factor (OMF) lipoprotein
MKYLVFALPLLTAGCVIGPKYAVPTAPQPVAWKEGLPPNFKEAPGWKLGEPKDDMHRGKWWEIFGDPQLSALEEQIDVNNQTIAGAEAQVRSARAAIRVARAALYPTLSGGVSATGNGQSGTIAGTRGASQYALLQVPSVSASWEPDLWGQVRQQINNAVFNAQAQAANLENVRLTIQAEVAADYFSLRGQDGQKQLLDTTTKAYEQALQLTVNRYNQGVASQVDVAQAQTQLAQTQAQATDTLVTRQQYEHAIAILIGKPPSDLTVPVAPIGVDPPVTPGMVPSMLLERRPDIANNERLVAAANANVGVAITAYYPNVTLSASAGLEGSSLLSLFTWPSRFWSLGPSLSELIFDAGKRRGQVEQAEASYDQAVATYRESVLTAFQQVEDQLAALRILDQESKQQAAAVAYAERSLQLAVNQYEGGITNYLQVITAQETALVNEVTAVQLKTRLMTSAVSLVQALGGGWDVSQLPSPADITPKKPGKVAASTGTGTGTR